MKETTTCRKCCRMVYLDDVDEAGRCCFCAEPKKKKAEREAPKE